jgi:hypothetical protein
VGTGFSAASEPSVGMLVWSASSVIRNLSWPSAVSTTHYVL